MAVDQIFHVYFRVILPVRLSTSVVLPGVEGGRQVNLHELVMRLVLIRCSVEGMPVTAADERIQRTHPWASLYLHGGRVKDMRDIHRCYR